MKKYLKWIIIGLILLIVILILTVLLLPSNGKESKNNKENNTTSSEEKKEELKSAKDLGIVVPTSINNEPGYKEYYTALNCISQYLNAINENNSIYFGKDQEGNLVKNVSQEEINKKISSLLTENSKQNVEMQENQKIFIPINMLLKTEGAVQSYAVYGVISNSDMEYIKEQCYIVNLDTVNNTFSIEIINDSNINIENLGVNEINSIEKNDYNIFSYQQIDEKYKSRQVFNNLKMLILVKPEIIYERLENEYKSKRFESYENFKNYIENNRDYIKTLTAKRYKMNDTQTQIILTDQNKNRYKFEITSPNKYEVIIDNYIFPFEDDLEKYKEYEKEDKVRYNIGRWINMLNYGDYKFAYEHLDETFRESNYESEEDFANDMKSKYPERYSVSISNIKEEGNIFTAEVELSVDEEEFSEKYMTIVIKLEKNAGFTMSFDNQ